MDHEHLIKLAKSTRNATDEASWQYWREIARTLAAGVLELTAEHKNDALREAIAKMVTRLVDVTEIIRAVHGDRDGISPARCESILERCDVTLEETRDIWNAR